MTCLLTNRTIHLELLATTTLPAPLRQTTMYVQRPCTGGSTQHERLAANSRFNRKHLPILPLNAHEYLTCGYRRYGLLYQIYRADETVYKCSVSIPNQQNQRSPQVYKHTVSRPLPERRVEAHPPGLPVWLNLHHRHLTGCTTTNHSITA
jgi:hypothetical protein